MKQKDKNKIKKLLIDAMAFLKVEAYIGISDVCGKIVELIDDCSCGDDSYKEGDEFEDYDEDEDDYDSSF